MTITDLKLTAVRLTTYTLYNDGAQSQGQSFRLTTLLIVFYIIAYLPRLSGARWKVYKVVCDVLNTHSWPVP